MTLTIKSNSHSSHVLDYYVHFFRTFKIEIPRLRISITLRDILIMLYYLNKCKKVTVPRNANAIASQKKIILTNKQEQDFIFKLVLDL